MIADRGNPTRNKPGAHVRPLPHAPKNSAIYQSENLDVLALVIDDPHIVLESGQFLFAECDPPTCMYIVKTGAVQIRSGSVVYEDVGPGGIVGEMCLVEKHQTRSATVYALTDSELVEIDDARFSWLIAQAPSFAVTVMQGLSRRLRVMDRRYRPSRGLERQTVRLCDGLRSEMPAIQHGFDESSGARSRIKTNQTRNIIEGSADSAAS